MNYIKGYKEKKVIDATNIRVYAMHAKTISMWRLYLRSIILEAVKFYEHYLQVK